MAKTWKAATKRIIKTKTQKLLKKKAGQNHFNTKERGKTVMGKRRKVRVPSFFKNML
jgi:ribosomal protein L35